MAMIDAHRIRLRGFWDVAILPNRRVRHRRAFGRPRTLDPNERAWLVCDAVPGPVVVYVNDIEVGRCEVGPFAVDVTDHLAPRNAVAFETVDGGTLGEVALEIRRRLA